MCSSRSINNSIDGTESWSGDEGNRIRFWNESGIAEEKLKLQRGRNICCMDSKHQINHQNIFIKNCMRHMLSYPQPVLVIDALWYN